MSKKLGLRYIVLSQDSDNLKEKYLSVKFKRLDGFLNLIMIASF